MKIVREGCYGCGGFGFVEKFVVPDDNINIACKTTEVCEKCDGKGYKEYATFSVEEAKAILKHCGLDKE